VGDGGYDGIFNSDSLDGGAVGVWLGGDRQRRCGASPPACTTASRRYALPAAAPARYASSFLPAVLPPASPSRKSTCCASRRLPPPALPPATLPRARKPLCYTTASLCLLPAVLRSRLLFAAMYACAALPAAFLSLLYLHIFAYSLPAGSHLCSAHYRLAARCAAASTADFARGEPAAAPFSAKAALKRASRHHRGGGNARA